MIRKADERYKELIEKYDTKENNDDHNDIFIRIVENNNGIDNIIYELDNLFSIGENRKFENLKSATTKFHRLWNNRIVKNNMKKSYRFELVINDLVEIIMYQNMIMSKEIFDKMNNLKK